MKSVVFQTARQTIYSFQRRVFNTGNINDSVLAALVFRGFRIPLIVEASHAFRQRCYAAGGPCLSLGISVFTFLRLKVRSKFASVPAGRPNSPATDMALKMNLWERVIRKPIHYESSSPHFLKSEKPN